MAHPDVFKPYKLYTDACDYAIGGILCQLDEQGIERVIQYISHQLNPIQRRWATIEWLNGLLEFNVSLSQ